MVYIIFMYLSIYPVAISIKSSNEYQVCPTKRKAKDVDLTEPIIRNVRSVSMDPNTIL